ncbi:MAG: hypothetical protein ACE5J4_02175 [Candidatus Aenigmatarchaeota archaeon]
MIRGKKMKSCPGKGLMIGGLGLFIFGLVLWYTGDWSIAFMIVGILGILKGLYIYSKK